MINALVDGSKILGEQLWSSFKGCHATCSLKMSFTRKVAWWFLIKLHSCSWHILEPASMALKRDIICLCSISGSHSNSLLTKYSNLAYVCIWAVVYMQALEPNRNYLCTKQSDSAARYILLIGRGEIENIEGQVK